MYGKFWSRSLAKNCLHRFTIKVNQNREIFTISGCIKFSDHRLVITTYSRFLCIFADAHTYTLIRVDVSNSVISLQKTLSIEESAKSQFQRNHIHLVYFAAETKRKIKDDYIESNDLLKAYDMQQMMIIRNRLIIILLMLYIYNFGKRKHATNIIIYILKIIPSFLMIWIKLLRYLKYCTSTYLHQTFTKCVSNQSTHFGILTSLLLRYF